MSFAQVDIVSEPTGAEAPVQTSGVERPENVPEQFWDAEKGVVNTEALLAAVTQKAEDPKADEQKPAEGEAPKDGDKPKEDGATDEKDTEANKIAEEAGVDVSAVEAYFVEKGEIPADTYEKLAKVGIGKEMVDEFVQYRVGRADAVKAEIMSQFGGETAVTEMTAWAGASWTPEKAAAFNAAVTSGDRGQIELALQALQADFTKAKGLRPSLLKPTSGVTSASGAFQSLEELSRAQADPRYRNDPAYRRSVEERLRASNF